MGKNSKAQDAEQRRQYREEKLRAEAEKQKKQNRLMWQIICGVLAGILLIAAVSFAITEISKKKKQEAASELGLDPLEGYAISETATNYVRMLITYTDKSGALQSGNVVVELRPDVAPITVENFQKLVGEGFYDGLTFHRVYEGFMIQGGDGGTEKVAKTIKGEFSSNGVSNTLSHKRGVISMARSQSYNSASSQFFIMHATNTGLDGNYAAFGSVVYGMETVDGIANIEVKYSPSGIDQVPTQPVHPVTIQKMVFVTPD